LSSFDLFMLDFYLSEVLAYSRQSLTEKDKAPDSSSFFSNGATQMFFCKNMSAIQYTYHMNVLNASCQSRQLQNLFNL